MATFTGTNLDEIITPTEISPTVVTNGGTAPGAGDDTIEGGGGADILDGGAGADTINGGAGNDTILGGPGANIIDGGDGDDTFTILPTQDLAGATFDGGAGHDRFQLLTAGDGQHVYDLTGATLTSIEEIEFFADGGGFVENTKTVELSASQIGGAGLSNTLLIDGNDSSNSKDLISIKMGDATSLDLSGWTFQQWGTVALLDHGDGEFIAITGDGDAETITGSSEREVIEGGGGADTIDGGGGSDTASYAGSADAVTVNLGAGTASGGDAAGDILTNIENLIGSANADTLTGDAGDNVIEGGAGADTLDGGAGNDTLSYEHSAAAVTITLSNGAASGDAAGDTFVNFENVIGSAFGDRIDGSTGSNVMHGGDGNDNLIGRGGADQLFGEGGDDRFSIDIAQEATGALFDGGAGTNTLFINSSPGTEDFRDDTIVSVQKLLFDAGFDNDYEVTFLASQFNFDEVGANRTTRGNEALTINIEMGSRTTLDLSGVTLTNMTSPTDHFVITGDGDGETITGSGISDIIEGGGGADTINGGAGSDTASYAGSANAVTINLDAGTASGGDAAGDTLTSIENLIGSAKADTLIGDAGDNVIEGGAGADHMEGGDGNDTLSYAHATSWINVEFLSGHGLFGESGGDTYSGFENAIGSAFNDDIRGDDGANIFHGGDGNDYLVGRGGADHMFGDAGNDTISVLGSDDVTGAVFDGGEGIDTLDVVGDAETLDFSNSTITSIENLSLDEAEIGQLAFLADQFRFTAFDATDQSNETTVNIAMDSATSLDLSGLVLSGDSLDHIQFAITGDGDAETITGSSINDIINGGGGADVIDGGAGADQMFGGAGNDVYVVDDGGDVVDESVAGSNGIDTIRSTLTINLSDAAHVRGAVENAVLTGSDAINVFGNTLANVLVGNGGNNTLNGLAGADTMRGMAGNDVYVVDNAGDIVDESVAGSGGTDWVVSSLTLNLSDGAHIRGAVENAQLTGSEAVNAFGNGLDNVLVGNAGNNTLNGLAGADTMRGMAGNDIYVVDNAGDVVDESVEGSAGTDWVLSSLTVNLNDAAHFLGAIENVQLTGTGNTSATGNGLANVLVGNAGNNLINGNAGADTMRGMAGNDVYIVDNAGDVVDESIAGSGGIDTINSVVSVNLSSANFLGAIENAVLAGTANVNGYGNTLANVINGNGGANILNGLAGNDTLRGMGGNDRINGGTGNDTLVSGAGNDAFVFNSALHNTANVDTITDFSAADDTIWLENAIFSALTATGTLAASAFHVGAAATSAAQHIIYNSANGWLSYDADGNGAGAAIHFATLSTHPTITNADFVVV